jgi:tetratricopeptide (TPR) repeat protein
LPSKQKEEAVSAHGQRAGLPTLAVAALLAAAALAAYFRTFSVPFLFDDAPSIADNATIRHLGSAFIPGADNTVSGRPVLNVSLAANYAVSGNSVWSYHAANLAIHIAAALALFGIVRRTLERMGSPGAFPIALFAALLWALHPLQTESVTYLIQRAESLMGLFYLATLYFFIRGAEGDAAAKGPWYFLSVASCFLGMGTKEVMVSAPLIVLFYDRTFLAGGFREAFRLRWKVHCSLACSWVVLGILVLSTHGRTGTAGFATGVSSFSYAVTQLWAITHYLRLFLWPTPLVFDYGRDLVLPGLWMVPYGAAMACLIGATAWALVKRPALGFLGICFFAVLAPSSSVVPVASETIAEHRMYLALAPLVVLGVAAAHRWLGRGFAPACIALAVALLSVTWHRNETYRSEETLWRDTVAKRPVNERAHNNLGFIVSREPGRQGDAIDEYEEALRISPGYAQAHFNLANALVQVPGGLDAAISHFEASLRLNPDQPEARYNLGRALMAIPGRMVEAIDQYEAAVRIQPDYPEAHYNLGCALGTIPGRTGEAITQYEEALRQDPSLVEAHFNLGCALVTLPGRQEDAIAQFEDAVRLRPDYVPALLNLATALNAEGRVREAAANLAEVLRFQPENGAAQAMLSRLSASRQ